MRALLNTLTDSGVKFDVQIETITVIRCLVRMTVMELAHAEDKLVDVEGTKASDPNPYGFLEIDLWNL